MYFVLNFKTKILKNQKSAQTKMEEKESTQTKTDKKNTVESKVLKKIFSVIYYGDCFGF